MAATRGLQGEGFQTWPLDSAPDTGTRVQRSRDTRRGRREWSRVISGGSVEGWLRSDKRRPNDKLYFLYWKYCMLVQKCDKRRLVDRLTVVR